MFGAIFISDDFVFLFRSFSFFVLQTCRQLTPDWCTIILPKKVSLVLVAPQTLRSPQVLPVTTLSVPSHFATCFRDGGKDGWDGKPRKDGWEREIYLDHLKQALLPSNHLILDRGYSRKIGPPIFPQRCATQIGGFAFHGINCYSK